MLAVIAEGERDRIRQRTRDALAVKKAAGVRLGRPSSLPIEVVDRIVGEWAADIGCRRIADALNADVVRPHRAGGGGYPATVRAVLDGQDAALLPAGADGEMAGAAS